MRSQLLRASIVFVLLTTASLAGTIDLSNAPAVFRIDGEDPRDEVGWLATICDVNGDGIDDLLLTAPSADGVNNSISAAGEAYVIYGRRGRWSGIKDIVSLRDIRVTGEEWGDSLGEGVGCGDVNGDGYDDLFLGAPYADGPSNGRGSGGDVHVVWGGASLPAMVDLIGYEHLRIYGALADGRAGKNHIVAGDIDGDGVHDLIVPARRSRNKDGSHDIAGRVGVLFGRLSWPQQIDLLSDADLTIFGDLYLDRTGANLASGDIDQDGTDDLLVTVSGGDGPGDSRYGAGEVQIFFGRSPWPSEIDLAFDIADSILFGADPDDAISVPRALELADLDGDGSLEVLVGGRDADGRFNDTMGAGEARIHEPGGVFPQWIDLAIESDSVVYGDRLYNLLCSGLKVGDVNGDGLDDFGCHAPYSNGPENNRADCGEIFVFWGGGSLPPESDARDEADDIVVGALVDDRLSLAAMGDLNGDGIDEIIAASAVDHVSRLQAIWLISPVDSDGDGVAQLLDNCPLVANADQADADSDLIGDACQGDYDGDGQEDTEDCAPGNSAGGTPAGVTGLAFETASKSSLHWAPAGFSDLYDTIRGDLDQLGESDFGSCQNAQDPDLSDTAFADEEEPAPEAGFSYLVRGYNTTCSEPGSYGRSSFGVERENQNPGTCP